MAVPRSTIYKSASGSGEQQFHCWVGVDVDGSGTVVPYVMEVRFHKDLYDQMGASSKTELDALTVADLIAAVYGNSTADKV